MISVAMIFQVNRRRKEEHGKAPSVCNSKPVWTQLIPGDHDHEPVQPHPTMLSQGLLCYTWRQLLRNGTQTNKKANNIDVLSEWK